MIITANPGGKRSLIFLSKEQIPDFGRKAELHNEEVRCRLAEYYKDKEVRNHGIGGIKIFYYFFMFLLSSLI